MGTWIGKTSEADLRAFLVSSFSAKKLKDTLDAMTVDAKTKLPADRLAIMTKATEDLRASRLTDRIPKVGQKAKDFSLKNVDGQGRKLSALLRRGPVVLTFYRGGWCSYCNAQLKA